MVPDTFSDSTDVILIIAFEQWVANPLFYDQLTDGQQDPVAVFMEYKRLMDIESEARKRCQEPFLSFFGRP